MPQDPLEASPRWPGRAGRGAPGSRALSRRAHIMGVVVSDTSREIRMATDRVTANSRNSRPTMPPMSRMGMNTATSEMLMETTVKPISFAPRRAASKRRHALLDVAGDVLQHHDGVVHHEARGDGQGHEREVVEAVAQQVHDPEGADERDRHRHAGDQRGPHAAQEQRRPPGSPAAMEMHQGELHVAHARPRMVRRAVHDHRRVRSRGAGRPAAGAAWPGRGPRSR